MPQQLKEGGFDISDNSRIKIMEYIYDMPLHLAACDLVICRSGAISIGEITALGLCSILIPSPNVTHNHQYYNALSLSERGAAFLVEEKDMSDTILCMPLNTALTKAFKSIKGRRALPYKAKKACFFNICWLNRVTY